MDKTERNLSHLFRALINPAPAPHLAESPSALFETDKYLAHAFYLQDRYQSPSMIERDVQILTVQMRLLSLDTDTAPAPRLYDYSSTPSREKPKRTGKNLNSGGHVKCPDCNMGFHTCIAMFNHIRIHQDKGSKGVKNPSINKPKPNARPEPNRFLLRKLTGGWTVTKNQSPKELPDMNVQEEVTPASILIDMSKSTWNCQNEKRRMIEFEPLEEEEEVAAILNDMPILIRDCQSQKRRMPQKTGENVNSGGEVKCPVCTKGFDSDKAMFGHMRIHQNKGSKGCSKNPSIIKPKSKARPGPDLCKLTASWTVVKHRTPRVDKKIPVQVPASILIHLSKSVWNGERMTSRTAESAPSEEDEEVAAILIDMPSLIRNCKSQKRRIPESARLENKKQRKNAVNLASVELQGGEVKENSDRKAHVCEICGKGFLTGPELGGHKRAHYKKEPRDQN